MPRNLVLFDLEWNIGYQPFIFNYHGVQQTFRGEIIEIGAVKIDEDANVLDTFSIHLRPRIFRCLQHHIAKVTGLTQEDLDKGEPIIQGLRRFMKWCGPDAEFAEWGMDDVPVLKQNLFLCNLDESRPTVWYDLQQLFLREYPRKEGEGMKLENVVTRMGIPLERPFHDALSDTLYTADLCRMLDLRAGLAAYPSEEDTLHQSLCPTPGDYRDFKVFRGYLDQSMWKLDPVIGTMACPVCGTALQPDDVWLKKGSSGWYTLSQCPVCKGRGGEAGRGVFQKYRMSRRDGLHWAFARCVQMPDDASLVRWKKQKAQYLERQRLQGRTAGRRSRGRPAHLLRQKIKYRAGKNNAVSYRKERQEEKGKKCSRFLVHIPVIDAGYTKKELQAETKGMVRARWKRCSSTGSTSWVRWNSGRHC